MEFSRRRASCAPQIERPRALPDETGIHAAAATFRGDQWDPRRWKMPLCIKKPLCMKLWVCTIPGRDAGMLPPEADTGGEAQIKRSFQEKSNVCLNSGAVADFALIEPLQWRHGEPGRWGFDAGSAHCWRRLTADDIAGAVFLYDRVFADGFDWL